MSETISTIRYQIDPDFLIKIWNHKSDFIIEYSSEIIESYQIIETKQIKRTPLNDKIGQNGRIRSQMVELG